MCVYNYIPVLNNINGIMYNYTCCNNLFTPTK